MFSLFSNHGILGQNARNLLYIKPFNPRKAVAFADDKLKTKAFLAARGIPVARLYARIDSRSQLNEFDFSQLPDECVLKPNYGFGGEGIVLLKGRKNGQFLVSGKRPMTQRQLTEHIEDILDGKFSVNGRQDTAFFEKILIPSPAFAPFRPAGMPDIRIIVFNLVPVMAMLRIPTAQSGGKANVHLGGIGIGIDMSKGVTTHAVQYNRRARMLPHGIPPSGISLPHWEDMLLIAARIQYITNIGYLGVDLTIDQDQGPVLLEVNARSGMAVQIANLAPLRARLQRVEGLAVTTPEKGVRLTKELFGATIRSRSESGLPARPVLGTRETVTVAGSGTAVDAPVLIAPDRERTVFSPDFVEELAGIGALETAESTTDERMYRVKFTLGGKKIQTVARVGDDVPASVRALIGRRDLTGFLIDPAKVSDQTSIRSTAKDDVRALDRFLSQADKELAVLRHVKPANLAEERMRALEDEHYNPVFQYHEVQADLQELEQRLVQLTMDDSPLGLLLKKKRREVLQRIQMLQSRGDNRRFTEASSVLYGLPSSVLLSAAHAAIRSQTACDLPATDAQTMGTAEAAKLFEEVLTRYGLYDWKVSVRTSQVSRCAVGGRSVTLREGATFAREEIDAIIAHEIEIHVLTAENGSHQPFELFRRGCANYLDTQEGLAIYNQNRLLSPHHAKRYQPAKGVLAAAFALEHSFAETRRFLVEDLGYLPDKALNKTFDLKRGLGDTSEPGAFTKTLVYFRGLRAIEQYVGEGKDVRRLFIGKIALEDLELLEKIPGLKPPILLPNFLRESPVPPVAAKKKDKNGKKKKGEGR